MQTQCPECETRFRVTDAQLEVAEGQVRCSICNEVFKAVTINEDLNSDLNSTGVEQDIELPEINADHEQTPDDTQTNIDSQFPESASPSESNRDNVVELELNGNEDDISEENRSSDQSVSETIEANEEHSDEINDQLDTEKDDNQDTDADIANLNKLDIEIDEQDNNKEEIYLNEQDSMPDTDVLLENNTDIEIDGNENNQKQHLDLFQDDNNQDSPQIIPDELRDGAVSNDISFGRNLAWASGILMFSSILLAQYFWFNRDQFVASPKFQALVEKACMKFDCSKLNIRDPDQIELLTRNVYSHPDEKNALMIDITLKNNAMYSQPYPVLQINFSDVRGGAVVARRFTYDEYLIATDRVKNPLLQPGSVTSFNLEIEDPGKQAITYEFSFL